MSSTLLTLLFGGVSGTGLTLLVTGRRQSRADRAAITASQWLVRMELVNAHAGAGFILEGADFYRFPTKAWEEERAALARVLPRQGFVVLAAAYDAIHGFNWRFDAGVFDADAASPNRSSSATKAALKPAIEAAREEKMEVARDMQAATAVAVEFLRSEAPRLQRGGAA